MQCAPVASAGTLTFHGRRARSSAAPNLPVATANPPGSGEPEQLRQRPGDDDALLPRERGAIGEPAERLVDEQERVGRAAPRREPSSSARS